MWIVICPHPETKDYQTFNFNGLPACYDSPDEVIEDYHNYPLIYNFNKDFNIWIFNVTSGASLSFWDLQAQYSHRLH
jgi:hypothetical protein